MLIELRIENLGIIEELQLVLGDGPDGRSPARPARARRWSSRRSSCSRGARADAALVRDGAAEARVEGRFEDR